MKSFCHCAAALALSFGWIVLPAALAVEITKDGDSWRVAAETYKAEVTREGHFRSLVVDGVELLAEGEYKQQPWVGGHFPGDKPAKSVSREGDALIATRDQVTVRYTFDDHGFKQRSEGGTVRWLLSEDVNACISSDGVIRPSGARGDVYRIVAGRAAVAVDQPHHVVYGRMFPSRLTRGGKPEEPFETRWTCGVTVTPEEQVDLVSLDPAEGDPRLTAEYAPGNTPRLRATLKNLAEAPARVSVVWTAHDHPHDGEQVHGDVKKVNLGPGDEEQLELDLPVKEPGLYWVRVDLLGAGSDADPAAARGEPMQSRTRGFIYDRDNYRPRLTRPEDFSEFWAQKLEAMRAIPFEPTLAKNEAYAIEGYAGFDLTINDHDGQRLACVLVVPEGPGPHDAEVGGWRGDSSAIQRSLVKFSEQAAGVGMWQRGARRIRLWAPLPEESTYTSWNGRDENNMLHSYLRMVRLADYLRSRDDVKHIWLFGASRTGASMLAAAALAPEQVAAVNVHVPTCCGTSWSHRPYRGWGRPPAPDAEGLKTAAYFDPVNFAPDLKVPLVMDGGFYDGLAPAPGILAFYNHAAAAPFRRCFIEQGPHGYFQASRRKQMEAELAHFLEQQGIAPTE